uniref:Ras-associating domain-containing protein n=1 Tax=Parastrongyloides trichosuri TaxID=131310 RepID=A0A0N5A7D0_PARTI
MLKFQVPPKQNITYTGANPSTSDNNNLHKTIISINPEPKYYSDTKSIQSFNSTNSSNFSSSSGKVSDIINQHNRATSLSSLSSIDSSDTGEWGHLKIYTRHIKSDTDYKTIKISTHTTTKQVIETILSKFRLTTKDPNLYCLIMEIKTLQYGKIITTPLILEYNSKPLSLQRLQTSEMCSFYMTTDTNGILVRIFDYEINIESNYKSLLLSKKTTCSETLSLLFQILRIDHNKASYKLLVVDRAEEAEIPTDVCIGYLYNSLQSNQKIIIRRY